jgi:hypothetical protein
MRHNADRNLSKTQVLESSPPTVDSCGAGSASKIQFIANQYVSECRVRLLRPISRSLPLALLVFIHQINGRLFFWEM